MGTKVTLERLDQKIDDLKEYMINQDVNLKERLCEVEEECKQNTKFRQKINGVVGAVSFVCAALGAFFMWAADKIWR